MTEPNSTSPPAAGKPLPLRAYLFMAAGCGFILWGLFGSGHDPSLNYIVGGILLGLGVVRLFQPASGMS